jgi:uncharacterized protein YkwD
MRFKSLILIFVSLPIFFGLTTSPADAKPAKPSVSMNLSSIDAQKAYQVWITGTVSKSSSGAAVNLQRYSGKKWHVIQRSKVKPNKTYTFVYKVAPGLHKLRVQVLKNKKIKTAYSKSKTVNRPGYHTPSKPPYAYGSQEEINTVVSALLQQHNNHRVSKGLSPLTLMPEIANISQSWAEHMAYNASYGHSPDFYLQYPAGWWNFGENIAYGYDPSAVFQGWLNSPVHKANIEGNFTHIGIGFARERVDDPDFAGDTYYTVNFASYD